MFLSPRNCIVNLFYWPTGTRTVPMYCLWTWEKIEASCFLLKNPRTQVNFKGIVFGAYTLCYFFKYFQICTIDGVPVHESQALIGTTEMISKNSIGKSTWNWKKNFSNINTALIGIPGKIRQLIWVYWVV